MKQLERFVEFTKFAQHGHGFGGPRAEGAHGAVIGTIGDLGGGVAERLGAHPMIGQQLPLDKTGHLLAHVVGKIIFDRQAYGREIKNVADLNLGSIAMQ